MCIWAINRNWNFIHFADTHIWEKTDWKKINKSAKNCQLWWKIKNTQKPWSFAYTVKCADTGSMWYLGTSFVIKE